jgi:hypothetical protein
VPIGKSGVPGEHRLGEAQVVLLARSDILEQRAFRRARAIAPTMRA